MQRTAIEATGDFVIGAPRLLIGQVFGQAGDAIERGIVAFEAVEIEIGQFERGHLAGADEFGELGQRPEGDVVKLVGANGGWRLQKRRKYAGRRRMKRGNRRQNSAPLAR